MIGLIDYGAGNLNSVKKAFDFLQADITILSSPDEIEKMEKLVLPGVGAFGAASRNLKTKGFLLPLKAWIEKGNPFLGICLGMQLMMEGSEEDKNDTGLSVIKGRSAKFTAERIPQIGWNRVSFPDNEPLFTGVENDTRFYFNHSYYVLPEDTEAVAAETEYGIRYSSALKIKRAYGVQFHPEKSADPGLKVLKNWLTLC